MFENHYRRDSEMQLCAGKRVTDGHITNKGSLPKCLQRVFLRLFVDELSMRMFLHWPIILLVKPSFVRPTVP